MNQILDKLNSFCDSIECESKIASKKGKKNLEVENIVKKIKKINTKKDDENKATKEKTIAFLYQHAISFLPTDKISGDVPISKKFLSNMIALQKTVKLFIILM